MTSSPTPSSIKSIVPAIVVAVLAVLALLLTLACAVLWMALQRVSDAAPHPQPEASAAAQPAPSTPTTATPTPEPTPDPFAELEWIPLSDPRLEVRGFAFWDDAPGDFRRLPRESEPTLSPALNLLARNTSGGRVLFRTNSSMLALRARYTSPPGMRNMHAFGQSGIDVYIDGVYRSTLAPRGKADARDIVIADIAVEERAITLYLPLYMGLESLEVGLVPGASVVATTEPATLPVIFYGTSITQGGCASRPGLSYPAMVSRELGIDFLNMGWSGQGVAQPEVLEWIAPLPAAAWVIHMGANHRSAESLVESIERMITAIRDKGPKDVPIICFTPILMTFELPMSPTNPNPQPAMRVAVRELIARLQAEGDTNLILVEGLELLGPDDTDGMVDEIHPNDLGFRRIADGLIPVLREALDR